MGTKRAASAAGVSDPGTANTFSTSSKRPCHDHDQTAIKGETAGDPIVVKSKDTDSLIPFIPSGNIITIYDRYDMTLIVGDQRRPKDLKAFRINRACLSMASDVFKSMLSGSYCKSYKAEIVFPDDSPDAFLVILRIIHWQHQDLPSTFTKDQLLDLAIVCDKYFLHDMVKMAIYAKNWLFVHRKGSIYLPVNADIQDWILIAHYLKLNHNYEYLINSLAMNLQKSYDLRQPSLYFNNNGKKVTLCASLPDVVLEKIEKTRTAMLDMIQDSCIAALSAALNQKICKGRGTPRCVSASIGILVKSFHEMDMPIYHSHPAGAPSPLHNSVRSYWEAINQMAIKNNFCLKGQSRVDCCSWEQCMSHLDPKVAVNAALEKYKHNGLDGDWASVENLDALNAQADAASC